MKAPTTGFVAILNADDVSTNPVVRLAPEEVECPVLLREACAQLPPFFLNFTNTHAASQLPMTAAFRQDAFHERLKVTVALPPLKVPSVGFVILMFAQNPPLGRANANKVKRIRKKLLITSY